MTLRGDFDPTQFDVNNTATYPPTTETDGTQPVYFDADRWNVTGTATFEGLNLVTGGQLFARVTPPPAEGDYWAESRSVYDVPFQSALGGTGADIWTRPMGQNAVYEPTGFYAQNDASGGGWPGPLGRIVADREYHHLSSTDPVKTLIVTDAGPGNGQSVHVRAGATAPGTWNSCGVLLRQANPFTVWQGQRLSLAAGGNPSWEFTIPTGDSVPLDLREGGQRTHYGSHGGSRLSTVAGTIKEGVLNGSGEINHPLQLGIDGYYFLSRTNNGFRWPAATADGSYDNPSSNGYYNGSLEYMRMGVLLALPANFDLETITEPRAKKICRALKYYGAYVVDITSKDWSVFQFSVEDRAIDAAGQWTRSADNADDVAFHNQLHGAILETKAITNNAAGQECSGGGAPIAANLHAPPVTQ